MQRPVGLARVNIDADAVLVRFGVQADTTTRTTKHREGFASAKALEEGDFAELCLGQVFVYLDAAEDLVVDRESVFLGVQ